MFTIAKLCIDQVLTAWELPGTNQPLRNFFYTVQWEAQLNALPGRGQRGTLVPGMSEKGRVIGTIDMFVRGEPVSRLIRPRGYAMEPPFRRMRPPRGEVVEMRTEQTRTFGFFVCANVFVADAIVLTNQLKADKLLYKKHADRVRQILMASLLPTEIDGVTNVQALVTD